MNRAAILLCAVAGLARAADPFPEPHDSEPASRGGPMPAAAAAASFTAPPGFSVTVAAAEPAVRNPIAMSWDRRGRLWVAENFTYAEGATRFDLGLRDRVLVFEDADRDGTLERRTVFTDSVQMLTGIAVGHGGVWMMCPPGLFFIPDRDGDAVPDGPAELVLDGFEVSRGNYHNFANGIRFGPDGWLYGRCGHSCPALIGRPGTPAERRLPMEGGMWRYHVVTGAVEVLTTGTTNPWGHDWNAEGECFFVNTVNGHLWHLIPGAHFAQANGIDPNRLTYELIDQHADHYHFDTGAGWQASRDGSSSALGGGHAHSGCMIYTGTTWPGEFRGRLFTLNFHGRRMNQEILERAGSGYVARHAADIFGVGDPWFRGIDLAAGPDGDVFLLDWSDVGECHERDGVHRRSGRIYRIAHGRPAAAGPVAIDALDDLGLARLQLHPHDWWSNHARLALAERAGGRSIDPAAVAALHEQFDHAVTRAATSGGVSASALRVRALLSLHLARAVDRDALEARLAHEDEHVRTWAIRLLTEGWPLDAALGPVADAADVAGRVDREAADLEDALLRRADDDPSALVRLALASTLQRLPVARRPRLAAALVRRAADADDHNLPLLVWYGLIPVAESDPAALAVVARSCAWPTTRRLIARRLAERMVAAPDPLDRCLRDAGAGADPARLVDVLRGMQQGLAGWRTAPRPASWPEVVASVGGWPQGPAREAATALAAELDVVFGGGRPLESLRAAALDSRGDLAARERALAALVEARPADLRGICEKLLAVRGLRATAARGLALFDDDAVGRALVEACRRSPAAERQAIIDVLVSRRSFAGPLLETIAAGGLATEDVSAFQVRQIRRLGDPALEARAATLWGTTRDVSAAARDRIAALAAALAEATDAADLGNGRRLFAMHCANCHRLYGEGGGLGPDLTGSGRHDLGYLLENLVDPSAVVNRDWRLSRIELEDGRVLGGVVIEDGEQVVAVRTPTETIRLPRDEIASLTVTDQSPMPEGLLDRLARQEVRDLVAYLRHPVQVPLPTPDSPAR